MNPCKHCGTVPVRQNRKQFHEGELAAGRAGCDIGTVQVKQDGKVAGEVHTNGDDVRVICPKCGEASCSAWVKVDNVADAEAAWNAANPVAAPAPPAAAQ